MDPIPHTTFFIFLENISKKVYCQQMAFRKLGFCKCFLVILFIWSIMLASFCTLICYYISPLMRCLFRSLAHFLIELFAFVLLDVKCSLYILDCSLLSHMSFAKFLLVCGLSSCCQCLLQDGRFHSAGSLIGVALNL